MNRSNVKLAFWADLSGSGAELLLFHLRCAQRGRTILFSSSFLMAHAPSQPQAVPSTAPPRISVGKWTQRYIRENAISTASGSAAIAHRFFPASQRAVTDAKDAAVCPDGKEKSSGRGIRSSTSVRTSQGRMRPASGLRRILQRTASKSKCRRQHPARPPRPTKGQQQSGQRQPDKTGVAQMGEKAHDSVQRRCVQGLQSVQESEFGVHEVSSFSFRSVYRIPEVCEQKSTKS